MKAFSTPRAWAALLAALAVLAMSPAATAQSVAATVAAGSDPRAIAVDPVRNRIYVANEFSNDVTVLDGATLATTRVAVGRRPQHIGVNTTTNRIYVSNGTDASLSVIDGNTLAVTTLPTGGAGPILVDESINRIYVIRLGVADEVTYVNGNDHTWYTIATNSYSPVSMALNPSTRRLYVAHYATGDVRSIDTSSPSDFPPSVSIPIWSKPVAVAANPSTNKVYAITEDSRGPIAVIDGNTNSPVFLAPAGHAAGPRALVANPLTNRIYAGFANEVIAIDGASNALTFIPTGAVAAMALNPTANKVYALTSDGALSVIDGATHGVVTIGVPAGGRAIAVNPNTNRIYAVTGSGITVIEGTGAAGPPPPPPPPPPPSYGINVQGSWWGAPAGSEAGWGLKIAHQGNTIFATWFTYDVDGQPMWLVMSNGIRNGTNSYTGDLYRMTGPAFNQPFDATRVASTKVGAATLSFDDAANGNLTANVGGLSIYKKITRFEYSAPVPVCSAGASPGALPNYQDLWWKSPAGSESGWGVYITHQGDTLFVAIFTYAADGRGLWVSGSNVARTGNGTYSGALYRGVGPPYTAAQWDRSKVAQAPVGSVSLAFSDANNATLTYTMDTVTQTKAITRNVFATPATVCR
ncbi:MAG TPA: YncE family protein [Usitatibacter sp.]|nr:YncE family protein [Usitatibacter sp.]